MYTITCFRDLLFIEGTESAFLLVLWKQWWAFFYIHICAHIKVLLQVQILRSGVGSATVDLKLWKVLLNTLPVYTPIQRMVYNKTGWLKKNIIIYSISNWVLYHAFRNSIKKDKTCSSLSGSFWFIYVGQKYTVKLTQAISTLKQVHS